VIEQKGSQHRDELTPGGFTSNHSGGVLAVISTGQDIVASIALKPTSSITIPGKSINTANEQIDMITKGRHDPCVGIRAIPIVEAMLAITLMDHLLRQRGQNPHVDLPHAPIKGQSE
jgi:chorismate synthase